MKVSDSAIDLNLNKCSVHEREFNEREEETENRREKKRVKMNKICVVI